MSDPRFNAWFSMSAAFQQDLVGLVLRDEPAEQFPLINNLSDPTIELFKGIHDADAMDRLFRKWGGRDFRCWNCYIAEKPENAQLIRSELDAMNAAYPVDFGVLGLWRYGDGSPLGMTWDESEPPELTGEPFYPQPSQTINFMPDIITDNSDPENPVYGRPTELTDVLLLLGQPGRIFTPE